MLQSIRSADPDQPHHVACITNDQTCRLELDAWYVEHCSFGLDLRILWTTIFKVVRRENVVNDAVPFDDLDHERRKNTVTT